MVIAIPLYTSEAWVHEKTGLSALARLASDSTVFPVGATLDPRLIVADGSRRPRYEITKVDVFKASELTEEVALSLGYEPKDQGWPKELSAKEKFTRWWGLAYPYATSDAVVVYSLKQVK